MPRIVHLQIQIGAVSSQQSRGGRGRPPPLQALDHFIKMIRAWNVSFCRWFAALSWKSRCWYSAMIWNPFCNGMLTQWAITPYVSIPLQNGFQIIAEYQHRDFQLNATNHRQNDTFQARI